MTPCDDYDASQMMTTISSISSNEMMTMNLEFFTQLAKPVSDDDNTNDVTQE